MLFISGSRALSAEEQVRVSPLREFRQYRILFGENCNMPYSDVKTSKAGMRSISDIDSSATPSTELETSWQTVERVYAS